VNFRLLFFPFLKEMFAANFQLQSVIQTQTTGKLVQKHFFFPLGPLNLHCSRFELVFIGSMLRQTHCKQAAAT
jgi:hypothetical protein